MCDVRIAADTAVFAESFVKVGIVPGDTPRDVLGLMMAGEVPNGMAA